MDKTVRHILSLSGGKDSAALALYMRDRIPEMEYIFHDTEKELPETYEYLARLEALLGKKVARTKPGMSFDKWLAVYGGMIPSSHRRWCTRMLELKPFEEWLRPHLDSGALEPVLMPWWQAFSGPFLYYPGRRHLPAPLRAFVDFIRGRTPY